MGNFLFRKTCDAVETATEKTLEFPFRVTESIIDDGDVSKLSRASFSDTLSEASVDAMTDIAIDVTIEGVCGGGSGNLSTRSRSYSSPT